MKQNETSYQMYTKKIEKDTVQMELKSLKNNEIQTAEKSAKVTDDILEINKKIKTSLSDVVIKPKQPSRQSKSASVPIYSEVSPYNLKECKVCKKHLETLFRHLNKSDNCKKEYDIEELKKQLDFLRKKKMSEYYKKRKASMSVDKLLEVKQQTAKKVKTLFSSGNTRFSYFLVIGKCENVVFHEKNKVFNVFGLLLGDPGRSPPLRKYENLVFRKIGENFKGKHKNEKHNFS